MVTALNSDLLASQESKTKMKNYISYCQI